MATYSSDRRSMLKIIGAIGATCAHPFASEDLYGQENKQTHHHTPATQEARRNPRFFNDRDFATISRISDLIIPRTESPGAIDAGVPEYLDMLIARNTDQQLVVADGLRWLDEEAQRTGGKKFLELSEREQVAILLPLSEANDANLNKGRTVQFFSLIKSLTADGYYTSQIGLMDELQYKGDRVLSSFPSCSS